MKKLLRINKKVDEVSKCWLVDRKENDYIFFFFISGFLYNNNIIEPF